MFKNKRSFIERITGRRAPEIKEFKESPMDDERKPTISTTNSWLDGEMEEGELAVDVYQNQNEIVIKAMVSGVKPDNLTVSITREMVTIRGQREEMEIVEEGDYFQKELYWGAFSKTIMLPSEVEPDEAEATEKHGLLTLRLPKVDREKVQKVKIKSL